MNVSAGSRASLCTLAILFAFLDGCRSTTDGNRVERHFSSRIWSQAIAEQADHPEQLYPELGLLAATPILMPFDEEISEDARRGLVTGGNTSSGDAIALGLGGLALGTGAWEATQGDGGRSLEVGIESLVATEAATQLLKAVVHRRRPGASGSLDSFPSGHASFSFAAATFLARRVQDQAEPPYRSLGALFYAPALYVAIDRVEGQRHFASDVAAGACLGAFFTNWIYNAHYGDPEGRRPAIFQRSRSAWRVGPGIDEQGRVSVGLSCSF